MNLLFDFDGPIVDLFDANFVIKLNSILNIAAEQLGCKRLERMDMGFLETWGHLRSQLNIDVRITAHLDSMFHQIIENAEMTALSIIKPDAIVFKMFETAYMRCFTVGIVSNNSEEVILDWLRSHELNHYVDFVVGRRKDMSFLQLKPNPSVLRNELEQRNLSRNEILIIGDTKADHEIAKLMQIEFIGILTRHSPKEWVSNLPWIRNRTEIPELLIKFPLNETNRI